MTFAQYTAIPDSNFENALSAYDDIPNDGQVPTANISSLTTLNVSNQNISDLTGIEDFTALKSLNCKTNNLTSINISSNLNLERLFCSSNNLTTLNVNSNTLLQQLYCDNNQLTSLDISANIGLTRLFCYNNQLTSLNTSANINLVRLYCYNNPIGSLNVSTNTLLKYLFCNNNSLTTLDVSTNLDLIRLYCNDNLLTNLDVSYNTSLLYLYCNGNQLTSLNTNTNLQLERLYCYSNNISSLNVNNNTALIRLYCNSNSLTNLDVSANIALIQLYCNGNQLTSLNTNTNLQLERLYCYSNNISSLNVNNNAALIRLYCNSNSLTNLDVSANIALKYLRCQNNNINNLALNPSTLIELNASSNQISTLDVSAHLNLQNLYLHVNQLTDLDVSTNTNLVKLYCQSNQLTSLNVKNGNNTNIAIFRSFNNPNLTCIEVDDVAYSTTNWTQIDPASSFSTNCHYDETYVPDQNFENYLETHDASGTVVPLGDVTSMGNGIANDHYVTTANINTVTNLDVQSQNIADMTGIEDFTALTHLFCYQNQLTSLDVSTNLFLTQLHCGFNQLTSLDVTNNSLLYYLVFGHNQISTIDLSQNVNLSTLGCYNNQLTNLNVNLNTNLANIDARSNLFNTLDFSANSSITQLRVQGNQLTSLNIANGNNTNFIVFEAFNNPNLTCVQVDDPSYMNTNWASAIDNTATYSLHCPLGETYVPDNNFENYLETHDASGTVVALGDPTSMGNGIANDDYVTTASINTVTNLDVQSLGIFDLTGIEDFVLLENLNVGYNNLTTIDVSNNVNLKVLQVYFNNLNAIDVSNLPLLQIFHCAANNIASLDVSNNPLLALFRCQANNLTSLDVSQNPQLYQLYVNQNNLTSLNVKNGNNTNITGFIATSNPNLLCIEVDDPIYSTTNWTQIDPASSFSNDCPSLCSYPTNLSAIPTVNNVTLSWQENGFASTWDLKIGLQGFDPTFLPPTDENVTNPFVWTSGLPNTSYDYYVRADCSGNNTVTSAWTGPFTFTVPALTGCDQNFTLDTTTPFNGVTSSSIAFADIDNDGDKDVLITGKNSSNQKIAELYTNNTGVFTLVSGTPFTGVDDSDVAFADVDNDGDQDVLITGRDNSNATIIELYLNNGAGVFTLDNTQTFTPNSFASVAFGDVDANGFPDLIVTGYTDTKLYTNTSGNFSYSFTFLDSLGKSATDLADVDGDGDLDLIISGDTNGLYRTQLYNNNGSGVFTHNATVSLQGVFRGDNELADIDNDGDLDLLITGYNAGTYYSKLYSNDGAGNFSLIAGTPFDAVFASSVAFGDVDNDNDKDLVITGRSTSGRISKLYQNDGTGTFNEVIGTPFDGIDSGSIAFADVDNDNDLDLLITGQNNSSSERIAKLYLNNVIYNTTYTSTGWDNGIPNLNKCAIIDNDFTTNSFSSYKTTVNNSKILTIAANTYMQVQQDIVNNGTITVEPTGTVVQIDDNATVSGAGIFNTKIQTTTLLDNTRYTYFSSPSTSETLNVFSPWANVNSMWEFDELNQSWVAANTATPMQAGNGYIIRGNSTNSYPIDAITTFNTEFNNGVITQALHFKGDGGAGLNIDNDSNLVGNPYPSAIDGTKLLNATLNPTAGTLYFWTHNSAPVSGNFSTDDYALWNLSGGIIAISGGTAPTGHIASGQGFFMEATGDETLALGTDVTSTLTFNNDMRELANNNDFRRPENSNDSKIWIDLTNNQGVFNQALIAFLPNATINYDKAYDGIRATNGVATLYSLDTNQQFLGIQALPVFNENTVVPLGYTIENTNITNLTISINHTENMQDVNVYLRDNLLNVIHNLNESNYNINVSEIGEFNTRFELLFNRNALSLEDSVINESLIVSNQNNYILVKTTNGSNIANIEVFDILGKQLIKTKVKNNTYQIPTSNIKQGTVLFVKATLENGTILNRKVIKI